jgi:antitoxin MazE
MQQNLRKIGNSSGIIIPKNILEQCDITVSVEIEVKGDVIVVRSSKRKPREKWDKLFKKAIKENGIDVDLFDGLNNDFDINEW